MNAMSGTSSLAVPSPSSGEAPFAMRRSGIGGKCDFINCHPH